MQNAELVGGPWCGKPALIPAGVQEWHLPASAFGPADPAEGKLVYRRRGESAMFDYVETLAP